MEPQRRGRFGHVGPVPTYSTTTRRGTRVSVGGCCLPLPIGCLTLTTAAASLALASARRRRRSRPRR